MQENTKGTQTKYASSLLHSTIFLGRRMNCSPANSPTCPAAGDFVIERLGAIPNVSLKNLSWKLFKINYTHLFSQEVNDIVAAICFVIGMALFNFIIYLIPAPRCVREKFRD